MHRTPNPLHDANTFELQINNFSVNLALPDDSGLTGLFRRYADFYLCKIQPQVYKQVFEQRKTEKLGGIISNLRNDAIDQSWLKYIDFQLKMIRVAQEESWRLPALVSKHKNVLTWHTGGTRILANGIARTAAAESFDILCTDFDRDPAGFFDGIQHVIDDAELSQIFGEDYAPFHQSEMRQGNPSCCVYLEWDDAPGPVLHYVRPVTKPGFDWSDHQDLRWAPGMISTAKHLGPDLMHLNVFANDLGQIKDSHKFFRLHHQGPSVPITEINKLTHLANQHRCSPQQGITVWLVGDRCIDPGELLFWLQPEATCYRDRHNQFVFLTGHSRLHTVEISLSNL